MSDRTDWVAIPTLGDLIVRRAAAAPDRDAIVFPEVRETGAELLEESIKAGRSLLGLGIKPGEAIAILMPNHIDYAHVLYGAAMVGIRALLVNARYKAYELAYVLENADAVAVITTDVVSEYVDFVPLLRDATTNHDVPLLRQLILLGSSSPDGFIDRAGFDVAADTVTEAYVHELRE